MKYQQYRFYFYHFCFSEYFFQNATYSGYLLKKKVEHRKMWLNKHCYFCDSAQNVFWCHQGQFRRQWLRSFTRSSCFKACIKNLLVNMKILKQSIYHFSFMQSKFKDILRKKFFIEFLLIKNELFFFKKLKSWKKTRNWKMLWKIFSCPKKKLRNLKWMILVRSLKTSHE